MSSHNHSVSSTQPPCVLHTTTVCPNTTIVCPHTTTVCPPHNHRVSSTQPPCVLTQPQCVLHANMSFLSSELETIILQAMGYSLVMGTALHEEAWPKETPPIITSIVKDMVRWCVSVRHNSSSNACVVQ